MKNNGPSKAFYKSYLDKEYFLTDNNNNYIYANSFQNALEKVKNEVANQNSSIQKISTKNGTGKIRLSSDNIKGPPKIDDFETIPNSDYKYWAINTTNAPASMFSSLRKSFRGVGGRKKTKKMKKSKSKSRKLRSKKNK